MRVLFIQSIYEEMIAHCHKNPKLEWGGFLYGKVDKESQTFTVLAIFPLSYSGTSNHFIFRVSSFNHANHVEKQLQNYFSDSDYKILGCYHSHGEYPAIFSDEDRSVLQQRFKNKITIVYSPKDDEINSEFVDENGIAHQIKFETFIDNKVPVK